MCKVNRQKKVLEKANTKCERGGICDRSKHKRAKRTKIVRNQ